MKTSLPISVIQFLFILLFVYAAVSKLTNLTVFQVQLSAFPLIGKYANFLSWCVPLIELGISALLIIPKYVRYGLYASMALLLLFTVFLIVMLSFSKNLPCSCGGIIAKLSWKQHIVFNSCIILLAGAGIVVTKKHNPAAENQRSAIEKI